MQRLQIGSKSSILTASVIVIMAIVWAVGMMHLPTQREVQIQCYGGELQTVHGTYLKLDGKRMKCE